MSASQIDNLTPSRLGLGQPNGAFDDVTDIEKIPGLQPVPLQDRRLTV